MGKRLSFFFSINHFYTNFTSMSIIYNFYALRSRAHCINAFGDFFPYACTEFIAVILIVYYLKKKENSKAFRQTCNSCYKARVSCQQLPFPAGFFAQQVISAKW